MATLGNPKNTIEVLQKYHFNFQKKFGQNFLIDTRILEEIIEAAQITKDDFVLEIGPGIGTMTQYLCEAARQVVAVEIDTNLIPILQDTLSAYGNVEVLNEDILKVDICKLAEEHNGGRPIKVVANLPYYITTPIIMGLFDRQYHHHGAERSGRPDAGRSGQQGIRCAFTCSAVLCKAGDRSQRSAEQLYAPAESGKCSHSADAP
jgi:hypothetical protein